MLSNSAFTNVTLLKSHYVLMCTVMLLLIATDSTQPNRRGIGVSIDPTKPISSTAEMLSPANHLFL